MNCSLPGSAVHEILENTENTGVGCDFLLQESLPYPRIEPGSPTLQVDSLPSEPPGKPPFFKITYILISPLTSSDRFLGDNWNAVSWTVVLSSVQSFSHVQLFATSRTAVCHACWSITNSWRLLKLKFIKSVMWSNHFVLCHPLLLPPSIFPSNRVFSNESVLCIRWPKFWSFSFSISPSNEHSGRITFRMDWLDFLAVQGTLKSLL